MVRHTIDYEGRPDANRPLSRTELDRFFKVANERVERARRSGRKGELAAYRDAVLYLTILGWGIRRTEAASLNVTDWHANAAHPQFGKLGQLVIRQGKSVRGSPPDPVPRMDLAGNVVFPGHIGLIYRAKGATPLGQTRKRLERLRPDGSLWDDRTRQKVINGERGGGTPRNAWRPSAHGRGASSRTAGSGFDVAEAQVGRRQPGGGNARYAFMLRRGVRLGMQPTAFLTWDDVLPDQLRLDGVANHLLPVITCRTWTHRSSDPRHPLKR
jgi:hypothetical protein